MPAATRPAPTAQHLLQHLQAGRLEQARADFYAMGGTRVSDPRVLELGANIAGQLGRFEEELELWRRLHSLMPKDSRIARCYVDALHSSESWTAAAKVLAQFLQKRPGDVLSWCLLATTLSQLRNHDGALTAVRRAIALKPKLLPPRAMEGVMLARARRWNESRAATEAVAKLNPTDPDTLKELGRAWVAIGEAKKGADAFALALKTDPSRGDLYGKLASALETSRQPEAALKMAHHALKVDPKDGGAHRVILRVDRQQGRIEDAAARGRAMQDLPLPRDQRRGSLLDLALCEQALGHHDAAMQAALAGNALAAEEHVEHGWDLDRYPAMIDRVHAWNRRRLPVPPRTSGRAAPLFLVGFPRSGTTLTENILAAHPAVKTLDEVDPAFRALKEHFAGQDVAYPACMEALSAQDWQDLRAAYWRTVDTLGAGDCELLVDKQPLNLVRLDLLAHLFPDAKLLVVLRDPRASVLSNLFQDFRANAAMVQMTSLPRIAALYDKTMALWLSQREAPPLPTLEVRYEDLVADPADQAARLLTHAGLPWHDAVLQHHQQSKDRVISTPSYIDVAKPIYRRATARWKHYASYLAPIDATLAPYVQAFGYEPTAGPPQAEARAQTTEPAPI